MKLTNYIKLGWDQLKRRIVVTALCAMGIAIGSASIIVALSFGESINQFSKARMYDFLKSDEISVRSGSGPETGAPDGDPNASKPYELTQSKIDLIRSFPHMKALSTYRTLHGFQLELDNKKGYLNEIYATELDTLDDFGIELQQGGPSDLENTIILSYGATMGLQDEQVSRTRNYENEREAMQAWREQRTLAYPMYQKLITLVPQGFGASSGESVSIPVRVVGILKKPEGMSDDIVSNQKIAYVSPALGKRLSEAQALMNGGQERPNSGGQPATTADYDEVKVKVTDSSHVKEVEELLKKLKLDVQTNLYREERIQSELMIVRIVFGGAGLFILFVASISIVVAMTMSTYQRRRQIGIMKVLGANLRQIRNMFMVESALLGLLGGLVGILLSYWVVWAINIVIMRFSGGSGSEEILFISLWILPLGLFFAIMTGVLSGIYPAVKASRTDALTAIKRD
ncbi:ABC transporter permease [Paenibacillus validus]|uniref:FtsX-like permease family protein n=1 Tax=Paenibacillus validus TaxID=44253 RepID=A0A7X2ZBX3_9BACL|nr:ABC transporter permease [Paenibacillus validus]MUG71435.1 FtsX-like permease family protein [Paenibacillus validus]